MQDKRVVAVEMKYGMKGLMGRAGLTEYSSIDLSSEPLDAVPLLVHAPEVVPPYITNTRKAKSVKRVTHRLSPIRDLPP